MIFHVNCFTVFLCNWKSVSCSFGFCETFLMKDKKNVQNEKLVRFFCAWRKTNDDHKLIANRHLAIWWHLLFITKQSKTEWNCNRMNLLLCSFSQYTLDHRHPQNKSTNKQWTKDTFVSLSLFHYCSGWHSLWLAITIVIVIAIRSANCVCLFVSISFELSLESALI